MTENRHLTHRSFGVYLSTYYNTYMLDSLRKQVDDRVNDGQSEEYTRRGEEGTLHRLEGDDGQAYWVKRWYRSHDKPVSTPYQSRRPLLSPYWHEKKRLEGEIVHALFPDFTPETVGSYDERIQMIQGPGGAFRGFQFVGTPVTVTREALADEELLARLNTIIEPAYDVILKRRDKLQGAGQGIFRDEFVRTWRRDVDRMVRDVLGDDIRFDSTKPVETRIKDLKERSPENVMIKMMEAGIIPIHPELNFIPGPIDQFPQVPHGTFIENDIYDPIQVRAAIMDKFSDDPKQEQQLMDKVEQFELYRVLDGLFDRILLNHHQISRHRPLPGVMTMVFVTMDDVRKTIGQTLYKRNDVLASMERIMHAAIVSSPNPQEVIKNVLRGINTLLGKPMPPGL